MTSLDAANTAEMTMVARPLARHEFDVAGHVAKLRAMVTELRRQTDASVEALHTIRARTSRVLGATEAFGALSAEIGALGRRLDLPVAAARLNATAEERAAFQAELHLLIDLLESYRQRFAPELAATKLRRTPPKRRWWHVFK